MKPSNTSQIPSHGRHSRIVSVVGLTLVAFAAFVGVGGGAPARAETTTTTTPGNAQRGPGGGGPNRAFCRQLSDSQAVIAAAKGDAVAKLPATASEWVKIESVAPTEIKAKVTLVRKAFQDAATAKSATGVKAQPVADAGKVITTFVTANCQRGGGGFGGGGPNNAAFTAYRDCLTKQGVTLPTPGSGQPLDSTSPKIAAALKACADKLPAGATGGGFGGGGGRGFGAIRDCLAKKNITFPTGQRGAGGAGGAQLDAKTQKAIADCRAEAQAAAGSSTTTTKKK